MKLRKIKHLTAKFFGWKEDGWARLGGRWGTKRSYGHFAGMADMRTRAELPDAGARADAAAVNGAIPGHVDATRIRSSAAAAIRTGAPTRLAGE